MGESIEATQGRLKARIRALAGSVWNRDYRPSRLFPADDAGAVGHIRELRICRCGDGRAHADA